MDSLEPIDALGIAAEVLDGADTLDGGIEALDDDEVLGVVEDLVITDLVRICTEGFFWIFGWNFGWELDCTNY